MLAGRTFSEIAVNAVFARCEACPGRQAARTECELGLCGCFQIARKGAARKNRGADLARLLSVYLGPGDGGVNAV